MRFRIFGWIVGLVLCGSVSQAANPPDLNSDDLFRVDVRTSYDPLLSDDVYLEGNGTLRGVVWLRSARGDGPTVPADGARIFLFQKDRLVDQAVVSGDGRFALVAGKPGEYQLAGEFTPLMKLGEAKGMKPRPIRQITFQKPDDKTDEAARQEPLPKNPGAVLPEMPSELSVFDDQPMGTPPNGNASVFLDQDGAFRFLGQKHILHHASNDEVFLDKVGNFRGVVTYLDKDVVRRPLIKANVYLVQRGESIARTVTSKNGSFLLASVEPGPYTIVAEYGYNTLESVNLNGVRTLAAHRGKNEVARPPVIAWERDRAGLPWQDSAGQLALQRIAVRPYDRAVTLGPVSERTRPGAATIVQVKFQQQNAGLLPVLHLSPSPWSSLPTNLSAAPGGAAGAAAAGGGGGGGGAAAGGGFLLPPFFPGTGGSRNTASPF